MSPGCRHRVALRQLQTHDPWQVRERASTQGQLLSHKVRDPCSVCEVLSSQRGILQGTQFPAQLLVSTCSPRSSSSGSDSTILCSVLEVPGQVPEGGFVKIKFSYVHISIRKTQATLNRECLKRQMRHGGRTGRQRGHQGVS